MRTTIDQDGRVVIPIHQTTQKLTKSGDLVEVYRFGKNILLGRKYKKPKDKETTPRPKPSPEEVIKSSARRAKRMIKRLIYSNSFIWLKQNLSAYIPITVTLTFAENIQDLKVANYEFTKFIRRLNYETNRIEGRELKQSRLKYLAVFEQQKRGAIHYHCIFFNLPYIPRIYDRLKDIWGQGIINVDGQKKILNKVKTTTKLKKIIDYFVKYIQKSILERQFPNQKKYITSKGLIKPLVHYFEEVINLIRPKLPPEALEFSHSTEQDYYNGTAPETYLRWINYESYDLSSRPDISKEIEDIMKRYS